MVANVVFLILGAVIGIALGYFFAASRKTVATETDNSELITLRQDVASSRTQVEELTRRLEDAEHRAAGLIQFQTQAAAAQARAQQLEVQLSKMESSAKQNSDVLEILTPIRQQLEQMHDRVDSMERQRAEQHGKLSQQLEEAAKRDDGIATANAEQTTSIIKALAPVRTELEEMQKRVRLMEQQRSTEHANLTEQLKATAKRETELALAAQKSTTGTDSVLGLLKPVETHLVNLGKRIDEMEQQRARQHGVLDTRLKQAEQREAEQREAELVQATNSLTGALRSRSARGMWGEVELVRVLEAAGMLNHVDFAQQQSIGTLVQGASRPNVTAGTDNDRSRPDVTIFLPGGGFLAVDSKTPMDAYLQATDVDGVGEQADSERKSLLAKHAKALRNHVDILHSRDYAAALGSSPEIVVLFVPSEAALSAALESDSSLLEYAFRQGVALASPVTLLALARTCATAWARTAINDQASEVIEFGSKLYKRLGVLADHIDKLGKNIQKSVQLYNNVASSLEKRFLVQARQITALADSSDRKLTVTAIESEKAIIRPFSSPELTSADVPELN
ncbi:DNA recombination protein RmuC [Actinomyces sp. ICM47]|uniref:DNA recombination protein RmuC n=1 Tax=Actinomyces sp. ICM47 TaxID=936548 RepID=UPI0025BA7253|nr:DNA recombination protein RmuC [Actinomyces sp. ICM47]